MARRRNPEAFSLSFLDVMSCGFGAVILLYVVLSHDTQQQIDNVNANLQAEVDRIQEMVTSGRKNLVVLRNTLEQKNDEIVSNERQAMQVLESLAELNRKLASVDSTASQNDKSVETLKQELRKLEEQAAELRAEAAEETAGKDLRTFAGEGDRQYLTGLKIGGKNILILLDASASMLDERIVNIIRLRNMPKETQLKAEKWQRALRTVDWIMANIPLEAKFQLYTFNTETKPVLTAGNGRWLDAADAKTVDDLFAQLRQTVPSGGTDLGRAFAAIRALEPLPDNIFLVTDSLPTQSGAPQRAATIESEDRMELFKEALDDLPVGIPVNTILFAMEGDPMAAGSFWQLAQFTGGSFLCPPRDWP